jgi:hypothetical protein
MDSHENEYLAAIASLPEQTISPATRPTYAAGDFVSGTTRGKRWSGRVEWVEGDWLSVNVDGAWVLVPIEDVTH